MVELTDIQGIGPATAEALSEQGIDSVEELAEADAQTVEETKNVTEKNAQMFIVRAQDLLGENEADVEEEDLPVDDDVSDEGEDDPTEDLFPESPSEDAGDSSDTPPSEDDGEHSEEADASSEGAEETTDSYTLSLELTDHQYDLVMYALVEEYMKQQRRNRERAEHAGSLLEDFRYFEGGTFEREVSRGEMNTFYSAVRSIKRFVQGKNRIELMHEMVGVVEQVEESREQLF